MCHILWHTVVFRIADLKCDPMCNCHYHCNVAMLRQKFFFLDDGSMREWMRGRRSKVEQLLKGNNVEFSGSLIRIRQHIVRIWILQIRIYIQHSYDKRKLKYKLRRQVQWFSVIYGNSYDFFETNKRGTNSESSSNEKQNKKKTIGNKNKWLYVYWEKIYTKQKE